MIKKKLKLVYQNDKNKQKLVNYKNKKIKKICKL